MSFMSNGIKRRAAYKYVCASCGKRRIAYKFDRAKERVCLKCQKLENNQNQASLFSDAIGDDPEVKAGMMIRNTALNAKLNEIRENQ